MKCHSNIPKYEEFKFLNECQIQFDSILESLKSARKLYLETGKVFQGSFDKYVEADPTPTKKYVEKMCEFSLDAELSQESFLELFKVYHILCTKNLIKQKDINSFDYFDEFLDFVNQNKDLTSKTEQKNLIKTKEADVILDDDKFFIISPLTHAASCIFGAGTKWCTTMKDSKYWNSYTSKFVKFYYCLDKQQDKSDDMYKFAVAVYPSGDKECYDAQDNIFDFDDVLKLGLKEDIFKPESVTLEKQIKSWFRKEFTIDENGFYSTDGDVQITNWKGKQLPIKFKFVGGKFDCSNVGLETLEGCPEEVEKDFYCNQNNLTSLEFAPKSVGDSFYCAANQLTSLKYLSKCLSLYCNHNKLTSLKGSPKTVKRMNCAANLLKSLEHGPEIALSYDASYNQINTTKGFPKKVETFFNLHSNSLESLKDIPTHMPTNSFIYTRKNKQLLTQEQLPKHCKATVSLN